MTSEHVVGYDGMWAPPEEDPRVPGKPVGELATIREYPELIDFYIKIKEESGDQAKRLSIAAVDLSERLYERQFRELPRLLEANSPFYAVGGDTYQDAYQRVQESSSTYTESRVATIRCLIDGADTVADLVTADAILQAVDVDPEQRSRLRAQVLAAAIERLDDYPEAAAPDVRVAGCALEERALRTGLEAAYRELARHAPDEVERIRLVDFANAARPRTWT